MRITRHVTATLAALAATTALVAVPSPATAANPKCPKDRICLYLDRDFGGPERLELKPYNGLFGRFIPRSEFNLNKEWHNQVSSWVNNTRTTYYAYDGSDKPNRLWTMAPGAEVDFVGAPENDRATRILIVKD